MHKVFIALVVFLGVTSAATLRVVEARPQVPLPQSAVPAVLRRAAQYAEEFRLQFSGIVTNETYVQDVDVYSRLKPDATHRELKSDLLLVRTEDTGKFVEFRDVAEVDGRAVRDRADRLTDIFENPKGSKGQLQKIVQESARYNIGKVTRNVNTPTLALAFLDPDYQSHFMFSMAADRTPALANRSGKASDTQSTHFTVPPDAVVLEYQETGDRSIIRSPEGRNMPAHGRFWIEPTSGRLLITELIAGDGSLRATINVSYQSDPLLGFQVPVEMRERYDAPNLVISGTATYGNFRRFEVHVNEDELKK